MFRTQRTTSIVMSMLLIAAAHLTPAAWAEDTAMASPLAIGGYCPVSYFVDAKAVKGDGAIRSVYADDTYYFASDEYKKKFDADPDKYLPQFGSWCTMALGGPYGNKLESDPQIFLVKDDKVYLFSSERAKNAYLDQPTGVLESAHTRFEHPWLKGYCPVSFHTEKKAVQGDPKQRVVFRRLVFYCANADAKTRFAKAPQKNLPEYAGFDPIHLAEEAFVVGDGKFLTIRDDKVYLFISEENKKKFDENPPEAIEKADLQQVKLSAFK